MNVLEVKDLSKSYDGQQYALSECSFSLAEGKILAIVGRSGSGKSTLLRLIAGLERPNQGSIVIKERVVSDDGYIAPPQERQVGLVMQEGALFPHLTVAQNIAFGLKEKKGAVVEALLKKIKMPDYAKRYPSELSGGEQQRVALARTLAMNPELLLLDEPFSSLDAGLKTNLRQEIHRIIKEIGKSMIFITHDIYDAIDIADEIIFLQDGRIIRHCPIEAIFEAIENEAIQKNMLQLKQSAERILSVIPPK
ncbi:MAG: ABC transporter ATP-binding protein [Bacteroidota bacterium]